jgi:hypothetical protein
LVDDDVGGIELVDGFLIAVVPGPVPLPAEAVFEFL